MSQLLDNADGLNLAALLCVLIVASMALAMLQALLPVEGLERTLNRWWAAQGGKSNC